MPRVLVCGAVNWDTTLFVDNLPRPGEEVKVEKVISVPGGKGGNTAAAAARILGKSEVGIICMLGSDSIADMQRDIFEAEGVDISCLFRHHEMLSGQAYVLVDSKGENMIMTHRAANNEVTQQTILNDKVRLALEGSNILVIIDPPLEAAAELAAQASKLKKTIFLSPATLVYHGFSALEHLLAAADYIILNEPEVCALATTDDGPSACDKLSALLGGKRVVSTLGAKGSIICHNGRSEIIPTLDPSMFGMKAVSTVGAGDTFVGALASFKLKGRTDREAIFLANVAATLKITKEQTRGSPTFDEIRKYAESDVMRPAYEKYRLT